MKTIKELIVLIIVFIAGNICYKTCAQSIPVNIYPDSVINDVSDHPVGINVNFLMDGGRFPNPKHSVTEALKEMGVKYIRYPGGEKSDLQLFSAPPYEKSDPRLSRTAGLHEYPGFLFTADGKFSFDPLDFDEYMTMCRALNAEPVVVVPADCYLVKPKEGEWLSSREDLIRNAVEWVRYANIKKKYGVKYWMVGNESWNPNNPNSTVDIYANDVIDFSKAMKAIDPSILVVANGEGDEYLKQIVIKTEGYADRICVSNYGVWNFKRGYDTYKDSAQVLIWPAISAINAIDKYAKPEKKNDLKVIVAEFGTIDWFNYWKGDNDMGHAIVNFDMAGQLLMRKEIEFSCFWNTRWVEVESKPGTDHDALDKDGNINPTGIALKIWNHFLGEFMVRSEAPDPIISYSSFSPKENKLYIYLINKTGKPAATNIAVNGYTVNTVVNKWEYAGSSPNDMKPVWKKLKQTTLKQTQILNGTSITVYELKLAKSNN